jgi:hypothetical protein
MSRTPKATAAFSGAGGSSHNRSSGYPPEVGDGDVVRVASVAEGVEGDPVQADSVAATGRAPDGCRRGCPARTARPRQRGTLSGVEAALAHLRSEPYAPNRQSEQAAERKCAISEHERSRVRFPHGVAYDCTAPTLTPNRTTHFQVNRSFQGDMYVPGFSHCSGALYSRSHRPRQDAIGPERQCSVTWVARNSRPRGK